MKKILQILTISLTILLTSTIWSCGSRQTEIAKTTEKKTEQTTVSMAKKSVVNSDLSKNTTTETATGSTVSEEKKETAKQEETKESSSQKSAVETSGKSLKKKTYYENGTLKSETDYTENFSKIESENANLKSKLSTQTETILDLKSANTSLQRISNNLKLTVNQERKSNMAYKKQVLELLTEKLKKSESKRDSFWLYALILAVGIGGTLFFENKFKI